MITTLHAIGPLPWALLWAKMIAGLAMVWMGWRKR